MAKEVLVRPPNSFLLADHAAAELAIACHHCVVSYAKWADAASSYGRRYAHIPGLVESYPNGAFVVLGDGLGFSVVVFTCCAIVTIAVILLRRRLDPPAELGGDKKLALATSAFLVLLWCVYVVLSSLKAYENELGITPFGF